ncbi:MAG: RDD family protein [Pseudomonadota bacterium]
MRSTYQNAGLMRRLGALLYDAGLLFSILLIATGVATAVSGGEPPSNALLRTWLVIVIVAFFGGFWRRGGQTLGMRAWRVTLFAADGNALSWRTIIVRLAVAGVSIACLGAGFWWALIDAQKRTWHDIASNTVLRYLPPANDA